MQRYAFKHWVQNEEMADPTLSLDVSFHPTQLEILLPTASKCPRCIDTVDEAGKKLKFPFGEKFRQGKTRKEVQPGKRWVAWKEASIFFSTQNSTVLYLNFFKPDIFVELSNGHFLTSPLFPQAFPPAATQGCQSLPNLQLQTLLHSVQSWDPPRSYIYTVTYTFSSSAHGCTSHLDGYMHIYSSMNDCSQPILADKTFT